MPCSAPRRPRRLRHPHAGRGCSDGAGSGSPCRRRCSVQGSRSSISCRRARTRSPCSRPSGPRSSPQQAGSSAVARAGGSGRRPPSDSGSWRGWRAASSGMLRVSRSSPPPASPLPPPRHWSHRGGRSASASSPSPHWTSSSSGERRPCNTRRPRSRVSHSPTPPARPCRTCSRRRSAPPSWGGSTCSPRRSSASWWPGGGSSAPRRSPGLPPASGDCSSSPRRRSRQRCLCWPG